MATTGALNTQDNLVMSIPDLNISKVFVQNIIDTGMESEIKKSVYYKRNKEKTLDRFNSTLTNQNASAFESSDTDSQVYYTHPLFSHE